MAPRVRLALTAAATIGLAAATLAVVLAGSRPVPGRSGLLGSLPPPHLPVRDFALRDQDGRRITLAGLRGHVVVLTFLYTTCRDTCPLTADQVGAAMDRLGHDVPALAVSVDPARDTPALARRFLLARHLTGRMHFLLGSRDELAPVWRAYGIRPQGRGFEHSAYVLVLDRRGRQRVSFPVSALTPEALAHDLRRIESTRA
jgi:protein SCO1/2